MVDICHGEGNGNALQYSCLENPVDRRAWWAAVHRVTQSQTWLKWLSMHACVGEGNGNPLQYSCLENPRDRGAVYGVAQSWTWLKWLSSSGSSRHLSWFFGYQITFGTLFWYLENFLIDKSHLSNILAHFLSLLCSCVTFLWSPTMGHQITMHPELPIMNWLLSHPLNHKFE